MTEPKQLKNCDHNLHLLFWAKYYLGCAVPCPLKIHYARINIRNRGERFVRSSGIASCVTYNLRLGRGLHSLMFLMWYLSLVVNSYRNGKKKKTPEFAQCW